MTLDEHHTNYAVAPGAYLQEWIEEHDTTPHNTAELLGCHPRQVNDIIQGHTPITPNIAFQLERVTSIPTDSWLRYETAYRADTARIAQREGHA